VAISDVICIQP